MTSNNKKTRVGVIGLGGMGIRWSQVVKAHPSSELFVVADRNLEKAQMYGKEFGCKFYDDWNQLVADKEIDVVVVAVPHALLAEMSQAALSAGKHVFSEKPGGISSAEIQKGVDIAKEKKLSYRVNFNMRLHPAVVLAKEKFSAGEIGPIMFMRGVYANSARENFEKEWRCNKAISGGGELIDQGSHLIDIANWFFGPFTHVSAFLDTALWNIKPIEDNAFILMKNAEGKVASLHASYTHWKKTFRVEIYGKKGYLIVDGLGGQYGLERLIKGGHAYGKDVPKEEVWEFPSVPGKPDLALINSWKEFMQSLPERRGIGLTARDAVNTFKIIEAAYRADKEKVVVSIG